METIIINKVLIHMLDFEHRKIFHSHSLVNLKETSLEYYHRKLEKAVNSSNLKELTVGALHEMILRSDKFIENDTEFIKQSGEVTQKLFSLGEAIGEMPNGNVLFIDYYMNGERNLAILKINYKFMPVSIVEENEIRIVNQQVLPSIGSPVEEAIIVNCDQKRIFIIEKKFMIDGKKENYLNSQWLKGTEHLSDKQKITLMKRVINKIEKTYNCTDGNAIMLMKQEIQDRMSENQEIKPLEIARKVLEKDYQAQEETEIMLKDVGIGEKDVIRSCSLSSDQIDRTRLIINDKIELSVPTDMLLDGSVIKRKLIDGTYSYEIKNISSINYK